MGSIDQPVPSTRETRGAIAVLALVLLAALRSRAAVAQTIHADGFEGGDLNGWTKPQTVNFTTVAPAQGWVNGPTYDPGTHSSSGLAVTLSIDAGSTGICSLTGSTVSFHGAGACVIDADQGGNDAYFAAPTAQQSIPVTVDASAPVVTVTSIYPTGGSGGPGVTYPAPLFGTGYTTGYDGDHFLFGDSVHVTASISDVGSGVSTGSLQVRLDGLQAGSTATGTPVTLTAAPPYDLQLGGCADGDASCQIEFDLPLTAQFEPATVAAGNFTVVVLVKDRVGNPAASGETSVAATRFWWSRALVSGATVTGLAVHPTGRVIATTSNASPSVDLVFALESSGPFSPVISTGCAAGAMQGVAWCFGQGYSPLGGIVGAAAISDDAHGQHIYTTTSTGKQFALNASGVVAWTCDAGAAATDTPGVASVLTGGSNCEAMIFAAAGTSHTLYAICDPSPLGTCSAPITAGTSAQLAGPPIVAGGAVYTGTTTTVVELPLILGGFGSPVAAAALGSIDGLAFDGAWLYAASSAQSSLFQLSPALVAGFTASFGSHPRGLPVRLASGSVLESDDLARLRTVPATATGSVSASILASLSQVAHTPLLGSDGRIYVGANNGVVAAVDPGSGSTSWRYSTGLAASFTAAPTMDCSGHLYAAAGDTVYAFLTDAHGLQNTPWPKYQRDSRNSGNADRFASNGAPYGVFNGVTCVP